MPSGDSSLTPSNNSPFGSSGQGSQRAIYSSGEIPQIGAALASEPRPRVPMPSPALASPTAPAHALDRRGQRRIDPALMVRIAAGFDKGPHRALRFGLAQQHAMHAAPEDLAELPGIETDIGGVGAVDRGLDDDRRRAVPRTGRPGLGEARHVFGEPAHVERAMLHPDIDVIGPGGGILAALRAGQYMPAMTADIINRLALRQQLDRPIDPHGYRSPLVAGGRAGANLAPVPPKLSAGWRRYGRPLRSRP